MKELDDDIVHLMMRRAFDVAGSSHGVKVFLNGKAVPVFTVLLLFEFVFRYKDSNNTSSYTQMNICQMALRWFTKQ